MMALYVVADNVLVLADSPRQAVIRANLAPCEIRYAMETVQPAHGPLFRAGWYSGTTPRRFRLIGVDAAINVRAGEFWRNHARYDDTRLSRKNSRHEVERIERIDMARREARYPTD